MRALHRSTFSALKTDSRAVWPICGTSRCLQPLRQRSADGRSHSVHAAPPAMTAVPQTAEPTTALDELPGSKRHFPSALPPTGDKATELICIKDGLWCLRQEFGGSGAMSIGLCMFVAQLSTGGLLAYTPIAPTEEVLEQLATLPGSIEHIILPNLSPEHYAYAPAFSQHFPEARIWCVSGLLESNFLPGPLKDALAAVKANPLVAPLQPGLLQALPEDVDIAEFKDRFGLMHEATLLLKRHRAVAFGDLCFAGFNNEGMPFPPQRWIARAVRIYKRLGSTVGFPFMVWDRHRGKDWATKVASWNFDTLLLSHLTPVIANNARHEFTRCFEFVLGPEAANNT